jgi:hypothetical protein
MQLLYDIYFIKYPYFQHIMKFTFDGILEKYENKLWNYHVKIPISLMRNIKAVKENRFICTINDKVTFPCAPMPAGGDTYFIIINQKYRTQLKINIGDLLHVNMVIDESPYGMPLPPEIAELLSQEPQFDLYFHQLTPGKIRALLYIVDKLSSKEKRIEKSMVISNHLIEFKGALNFKLLNEAFKRGL